VASNAVVNAGQAAGGVAPNTFISILGTNLAATRRLWQSSDLTGGKLATSLDGVTVTVNGEPAFIEYICPVQINLITPADMPTSGQLQVQVSNNGLTSASISLTAQPLAPSFYLFNSDKYIAATHANNALIGPTTLFSNGSATPAAPNETIVLYGNGFGQTTPAFSNGQLELPGSNIPLAATPTITFNSVAANVVFAGLNASGLYQLNVVVPAGLPDGDAAVVATVGGYNSPSGAFITIKN